MLAGKAQTFPPHLFYMDALQLANGAARMVQDKPEVKPMTPEYKQRNRQDLKKTFQYHPENDINAKLKAWFGLK